MYPAREKSKFTYFFEHTAYMHKSYLRQSGLHYRKDPRIISGQRLTTNHSIEIEDFAFPLSFNAKSHMPYNNDNKI